MEAGFMPHEVEEVWMSLTQLPDVQLDVTEHWRDKIESLKLHASQIGDPEAFEKRMLARVQVEPGEDFRYQEGFRRIKFRRSS
jgi:LmbE family N-acetylglucosaminyl deacetylase